MYGPKPIIALVHYKYTLFGKIYIDTHNAKNIQEKRRHKKKLAWDEPKSKKSLRQIEFCSMRREQRWPDRLEAQGRPSTLQSTRFVLTRGRAYSRLLRTACSVTESGAGVLRTMPVNWTGSSEAGQSIHECPCSIQFGFKFALTSYLIPARRNQVSTFKQYGDIDGKRGVLENWYRYTVSFSKFVLCTSTFGGAGSAFDAGASSAFSDFSVAGASSSIFFSGNSSLTSFSVTCTLFTTSVAIVND